MSITSLRRLCRCRLLRFWKMSQLSSWRSLKPTARWWFSRTDSSLYIRASSESAKNGKRMGQADVKGAFPTENWKSTHVLRNLRLRSETGQKRCACSQKRLRCNISHIQIDPGMWSNINQAPVYKHMHAHIQLEHLGFDFFKLSRISAMTTLCG